ncbi:hypothetical protein QVD17_25543 [Tagetes erecta]|uniref:Uncharacterized protein n=1 Tax=Tagetes erecta TaxID=13708 RepID=A0AAD8KG52_TARER|nr:hypothetical protein QVD17_25543 [Tagetes erecta]
MGGGGDGSGGGGEGTRGGGGDGDGGGGEGTTGGGGGGEGVGTGGGGGGDGTTGGGDGITGGATGGRGCGGQRGGGLYMKGLFGDVREKGNRPHLPNRYCTWVSRFGEDCAAVIWTILDEVSRVLGGGLVPVLYMEGEQHSIHRLLRAFKNRFGSTDEWQ